MYQEKFKKFRALCQPKIVVPALVFLAGFLFALGHQILGPEFYQREFAPAVMFACGHGLTNIGGHPEALQSFLSLQTDLFSCSELGSNFQERPMNGFQATSAYLLLSVGLIWKIFGVSWDALQVLYGVFFGATLTAAYVLLRTTVKTPLALLGTFLLSFHLIPYLPHLRDFSKVVFSYFFLGLLIYLVIHPYTWKKTLTISLLSGIALGAGYGFRTDTLVFIPLFLATLVLFLPIRIADHLKIKAAGAGIFVIAFIVSSLPAFLAQFSMGGGNLVHVVILGLMTHFDPYVGIVPSVYDWGHLYNDGYVHAIVNEYAGRVLDYGSPALLGSPEYGKASMALYTKLATTFPADMLTRFASVAFQIISMPIFPDGLMIRLHATPLLAWMPELLQNINGLSFLFVSAGLVVAIAANLRLGLFVLFSILYLSGFPFLQFQHRHFFHLAFIPILAMVFLVSVLLAPSKMAIFRSAPRTNAACLRTAALNCGVLGLTLLIFLGVLAALRSYQDSHLSEKFADLSTLAFKEVEVLELAQDDGEFLLHVPPNEAFQMGALGNFRFGYLEVTVNDQCEELLANFAIQYRYDIPFNDYSRRVSLVTMNNPRYIFPVFANGSSQFQGIRLDGKARECIDGLKVATAIPDQGLLPYLTLEEDWRDRELFQRSKFEPAPDYRFQGEVFAYPAALARLYEDNGVFATLMQDAKSVSGELEIKGGAETDFAYLEVLPYFEAKAGELVIVEGMLNEGSITIGIQKDDAWYQYSNVATSGRFRGGFQLEESGRYRVVIANNRARFNSLAVERIVVHTFSSFDSSESRN